ncbi:MAG TPA: CHASE domain-containing protein [Kiritimatiellia bacterium]|nr:CHASE domain-containing protein [Kiritimatiellia bacterium]HMP33161.1 CHASE domain-containing protein [Kiritimatiellia bacterium]
MAIPTQSGTTLLARAVALLILIGGLGATWIGSRISGNRHHEEIRRIFTAEATSMRNLVARQVETYQEVLQAIGLLHDLSAQITERDFEEFSSKGLAFQRNILGAYGFAQRMPHAVRAELERTGQPALTVLDPAGDGTFRPAATRPEYFPLVHEQPAEALGFPVGADLASLPGFADAIVRLSSRDSPVLVHQIRLQQNDGSVGHFMLSPLYQDAGARVLSGFTLAVLWPQQILERALADIAVKDVLVRFYDPAMHADPDPHNPSGIAVTQTIPVADAVWRFEARAADEYLRARSTALPGLILGAGSAITLLLAATIAILAGRTRRIETAVSQRTRELKEANARLSDAMHERMRLESEILEISEREKQRVGQDLHDSLGQKLTGAVFLSRALAAQVREGDAGAGDQAARINEILKESVAQVRRMARGLSPVDLGEDGLSGALQRLADETSSVYGITCVFHHGDDPPAPTSHHAHHLYAIALEAVNNAIRHGQAKEIVLECAGENGRGRLTIEDDGNGFDPSSTQRGGMGLRIMKYRATMIGGTFDLQRRPSGGMHISCYYPLG